MRYVNVFIDPLAAMRLRKVACKLNILNLYVLGSPPSERDDGGSKVYICKFMTTTSY